MPGLVCHVLPFFGFHDCKIATDPCKAVLQAAAEKSAASMELESCQRRLGLANRLITALASEGERWQATVGQLEQEYKVLSLRRGNVKSGDVMALGS